MNNKINEEFARVAYFGFPLKSHFYPYMVLFEEINHKYGIDVYTAENNVDFSMFSHVFKFKPYVCIEINNLMDFCIKTTDYVTELWERANYKPDLIISDMFQLEGRLLGEHFNVPVISLFPAFPSTLQDYDKITESYLPPIEENASLRKDLDEKVKLIHEKYHYDVSLTNTGFPRESFFSLKKGASAISLAPPDYPLTLCMLDHYLEQIHLIVSLTSIAFQTKS